MGQHAYVVALEGCYTQAIIGVFLEHQEQEAYEAVAEANRREKALSDGYHRAVLYRVPLGRLTGTFEARTQFMGSVPAVSIDVVEPEDSGNG